MLLLRDAPCLLPLAAGPGERVDRMRSPRRGGGPTVPNDDQIRLDDLLLRVAAGDAPAFEQVYDRVSSSVFGAIRRVLVDYAQSEEVAQEVLVEVWTTASRFDPARGSAMGWIHTMAHRRAVDRVRTAQAAHDRDDRVARRDWMPSFDEVAEEVEATLEHEEVRRCLEQLTTLQRESVSLAYYGGYSYREVAEQLRAPVGTVKTRMRLALAKLRQVLAD